MKNSLDQQGQLNLLKINVDSERRISWKPWKLVLKLNPNVMSKSRTTFENQSKEFVKKLITALEIQSNLAQNVSDEKNYENNSKDSNNGKEE